MGSRASIVAIIRSVTVACAIAGMVVPARAIGASRTAGETTGSSNVSSDVAPNSADPLYQSTGDQKRTYKFPPTGQLLPYRTYVPTNWKPGMHLPMVLVLHGGGLNENAAFERTPVPMKDELQKLAQEFQFIVVSPLGYNMSGGFGAPPPPGAPGGPPLPPGTARPRPTPPPLAGGAAKSAGPPPSTPQTRTYSVEDVMDVVTIVEQEYGVDKNEEFITGNSMGGIGTMYLVARFPGKWVAMAPSEAGFDPARYGQERYSVKGALLIHKQNDAASQVETESAEMVKILDAQGVEARTISVPFTVHETVWFYALPLTFHFFDTFVHPRVERMGPPAL